MKRGIRVELVEQHRDLLRLRVIHKEEGAEFKNKFVSTMKQVLAETGSRRAVQEELQNAMVTRISRWEVLTDPATLRPAEAQSNRKQTFSLPGEQTATRYDSHHYFFDWVSGAGMSPQCE